MTPAHGAILGPFGLALEDRANATDILGVETLYAMSLPFGFGISFRL